MDFEARLRRAAPPAVEPSVSLQQKILAEIGARTAAPVRTGWGGLFHAFFHHLIRYPIPVLTSCWLAWLVGSRLTTPFGTDVWLAQYIYVLIHR